LGTIADKTTAQLLEDLAQAQARVAELEAEHGPGSLSGLVGVSAGAIAGPQAQEALRQSEAQFQNIIDASPVPYALNDEHQNITYLNPAFIRTFGYDLEDIPTLTDWWPKAYPDVDYRQWVATTWQARLDKAKQSGAPFEPVELRIRCKDGSERTVLVSAASLTASFKGNHLVILYDISELKRADRDLNKALAMLENVINSTPDLIFVKNSKLQTILCNNAYAKAVGKSREEMYGNTDIENGWDAELVLGNPAKGIRGFMHDDNDALEGKDVHNPYDPANVDGEIRIFDTHKLPLRDASGTIIGVLGVARDITERKKNQEQIEFLAYHDSLTKLPNRLLAKDRMEKVMAHADRENSKAALLFLDLDNFKTINNSLGHAIGDAFLVAVAERLRECVRDTDTLSRQGGDEFLVMLTGMPSVDAIQTVSEKLLGWLDRPFMIEGIELATSLSIGVAVYPDDGRDFDTLLKKADAAMYQAKEAGRNTFSFYTEQMNINATEHLYIRSGLRQALEKSELVLHYQPQINLSSGRIVGAEALIRWNHPELGMVPPDRFIPVAEDSGLIVPIGEWVLQEACRQAAAWQQAGWPGLVVAVNLSSVQFKRGDLEKSVIQALTRSGLEPGSLELELTESILIQDTEKVLDTVRRLKSLGIKLSIDDFGTGYSSLSYLKSFAVDKLKIDQSFIRNMANDPGDAAIVHAVIQMARSLNLKTIAEGVEDEGMLKPLRLHHCDEVQGYYFARPMPADEFALYLCAVQPL